ncbi:conserved hypothetical protein [Leishmania major strain Friedlin]|uniref:Uncharacterized protein n=1 Tax=Leishmania major TaxID=5664 RepID=E9AC06_LEIMA|nr:conserved hypothetical protein [Leishmania major strain Friedlin]CAG9567080.1 hypothetical_protein_-_conserved [Leishmania major strain Friedlin]CBZ11820.1 conserved hypothetical protein [Leishmania major strain Friedlin]|eukprot:XP_003721537.1 conserved hypothetical protein [Leishmania major strain Friedlin]
MGGCCGVASEAGTASSNGTVSSTPLSPPSHRRGWRGSTRSTTKTEQAALKRSSRLESASSFLAKILQSKDRGDTDSAPLRGTVVNAVSSATPRKLRDSATHAAPAHDQDLPFKATLQHGANGSSPDLLLPDLFYISASSSSSLLANGDVDDKAEDGIGARLDGEGQSSLVEVSQPTQSFAGDVHTYSELDLTSEWEPPSFDCLGRRSERRGRSGTDRSRLRQLIIREAEVRVSLRAMYTYQHQRFSLNLAKEHFIAVHIRMRQEYESEWTVQCICWIVAVESVTREALAREWWAERAALVRRVGSLRTPPPPPPLQSVHDDARLGITAIRALKREDRPPYVSKLYTAADLTPSEEAAEGDLLNMCIPPMRASSSIALFSPPLQQQLSVLGGSRSASAGVSRGLRSVPRVRAPHASSFVSSPASVFYSPEPTQRVAAAQQAQKSRLVRGRSMAVTEALL